MSGLVSGTEARPGFRRIVVLLIWLVLAPTVLLLVAGILLLAVDNRDANIVLGILIVTLVGCLVTGAVLALVFLRREANLSKLQLDFVSKVSHELRTPLTSIRMFVEMLHTKRLTSPQEVDVCLEVLGRETARLTERIERLLDWGRMESGKRAYVRRPVHVNDVLDEATDAFTAITVGQQVDVRVTRSDDLPMLLADRSALADALVNLLTNAYKYSGTGKPIYLDAVFDPRSVRISVRDEGIGIPRREHRRIFDKFYRVDERLSAAIEGSGLGLAIVRHVMQAHGGHIELVSSPGRGSAFTLVVPRPKASALASARQRMEQDESARAAASPPREAQPG